MIKPESFLANLGAAIPAFAVRLPVKLHSVVFVQLLALSGFDHCSFPRRLNFLFDFLQVLINNVEVLKALWPTIGFQCHIGISSRRLKMQSATFRQQPSLDHLLRRWS